MQRWFLHARIVALTLCLVLVGYACSRAELIYNRAEWFAYYWADGLLDASDEQAPAWRERFREVMREHQRDLLPEVVLLLGLLELQAEQGLERATLNCWLQAVEQSYRRHAELVIPAAVAVLRDLDARQVDHLAVELDERNNDYREAYLAVDPADRGAARVGRFVDRVEAWTGELDTAQLRLVEQAVAGMPDIAVDWMVYRRQQQQRLLDLLRAGADDATLAGFLADWWIELDGRPAGLVRDAEDNRGRVLELVLALDASLEQDQRDEFIDQVRSWRAGFEAVDPAAGRLWHTRRTQPVCAAVNAT